MLNRTRYEDCVCVDASLVVKWLVSEPDSMRALDARQRLHMFDSLGIQYMHPPFLLRRAWEIANSHSLYTIYDASYAALSELTGTRLYTCDRALIEALSWSSDLVINPLVTA